MVEYGHYEKLFGKAFFKEMLPPAIPIALKTCCRRRSRIMPVSRIRMRLPGEESNA